MKRSRTRSNMVWLTLLAFSVQLAVTVLHHHGHELGIQGRAITAGLCAPSNKHPCAPLHQNNDGCALCWAAAIAATSLAPSVPELPLPSKLIAVRLATLESISARQVHREYFQARGPPTVAL